MQSSQSAKKTSLPLILAGVCLGVGVWLRWRHLGQQSLWFDEGYSAWMASHPAKEIIRLIRADTAPPLYYLTLHAWTQVFGRGETALRSLSALFSTITLLLGFGLARRLAGVWPAVLAAALAAVSTMAIQYAQETRAYAMMAMLNLAAVAAVFWHLDQPKAWKLPLIAILTAAGLYTHNMAITYLPTLVILWFWPLPSHNANLELKLRHGLVLAGITVLLYAPWAISSLHHQVQMVAKDFWVQRPTWASLADVISSLAGVEWNSIWGSLFDGWVTSIVLAVLAGAVIIQAIMARQKANRVGAVLFLHALIPPLGIAYYSHYGRPLLMDKVFLPSAALLPVAFALLAKDRRGRLIALLMLVLAVGGAWGFIRDSRKENWRSAVASVQSLPPQRRLIVFVANDGQLPFDYYRAGENLGEYTGAPAEFFAVDPPHTMLRVLNDADLIPLQHKLDQGDYPQVILVYAHTGWADPRQLTPALLSRRYPAAEDLYRDADIQIICYRR